MSNDGTVDNKCMISPKEITIIELNNKSENVEEFLCTHTIYANSLVTYSEVTLATQHAIEHLIFTHVGTKKGIKLWGEKVVTAIMKEMKQFHDRNVVNPLKPKDITPVIRDKTLRYLMFLKQKRNGDIKGRGYADSRPQRLYKSKSKTSSPTAAIEFYFHNWIDS